MPLIAPNYLDTLPLGTTPSDIADAVAQIRNLQLPAYLKRATLARWARNRGAKLTQTDFNALTPQT
jgi:hypothetical protein